MTRGWLIAGALAGLSAPRVVGADLGTAQGLLGSGRVEEAFEVFKQMNQQQGGRCAPCLVGMAEAKLRLGDLRSAERHAGKAAELAGQDAALRARALNAQGLAIVQRARVDDAGLRRAEAAFRGALAADAGLLGARLGLGRTLLRRARDAEGASELQAYVDHAPAGPARDQALRLIANPGRARQRLAPDFSARTLAGEPLSLASFEGRILLLDFWATWCRPCLDAIPEIQELRRLYPSERLAIVSVSVDDSADTARGFAAQHGMSWTQCHDADGALQQAFGVESFPTYFVVDGDGAVVAEIHGADPQQSLARRLKEIVETLP